MCFAQQSSVFRAEQPFPPLSRRKTSVCSCCHPSSTLRGVIKITEQEEELISLRQHTHTHTHGPDHIHPPWQVPSEHLSHLMLQIQDGHLRPSPREPLLGNTLPALLRCAASGRWRLPTDLGCVCKRVKKRRTENVVPLRLIREKKKVEASVGFTAHRRSLPAPIRRLDPDVLAVLHHQIINSLFPSLSPFELNQSI